VAGCYAARQPVGRARLGLAEGQVREDHILGYDVRVAVERLWAAALAAEESNADGYTAAHAVNTLS
jgi:hypothetical protein